MKRKAPSTLVCSRGGHTRTRAASSRATSSCTRARIAFAARSPRSALRCAIDRATAATLTFVPTNCQDDEASDERNATRGGAQVVVWLTGAPGTGKSSLVRALLTGQSDGVVDLERFPLHKVGGQTQLVWHTSGDGRVAVVGAYQYPADERFAEKRRGTAPACGGTDTLQPQSVGLLAQLVRGELPACGRTPEVVLMEACSKHKVGGPQVQAAMLAAGRLLVLECTAPEAVAVERVCARVPAKGERAQPTLREAKHLHSVYTAQVHAMRETLLARAGSARAVDWRAGDAKELAPVLCEAVGIATKAM